MSNLQPSVAVYSTVNFHFVKLSISIKQAKDNITDVDTVFRLWTLISLILNA